MTKITGLFLSLFLLLPFALCAAADLGKSIGQEHALPRHLADGEEFTMSPQALIAWGARIFQANWTAQDGAGRPRTKGTGQPLSDPTSPLIGPRAFNRVFGPDANSCMGCHNAPYGIPGCSRAGLPGCD